MSELYGVESRVAGDRLLGVTQDFMNTQHLPPFGEHMFADGAGSSVLFRFQATGTTELSKDVVLTDVVFTQPRLDGEGVVTRVITVNPERFAYRCQTTTSPSDVEAEVKEEALTESIVDEMESALAHPEMRLIPRPLEKKAFVKPKWWHRIGEKALHGTSLEYSS